MKRLVHFDNEPRSLGLRRDKQTQDALNGIEFDAKNAWDSFGGTADLHAVLLPTQHGLCCYCEIELCRDDDGLGFHIEHIALKSIEPEKTFVFNNLMLSCFTSGHELSASQSDPLPVSCGHTQGKKNRYDTRLFINTTEIDCEHYFYYELDGTIVAHPTLTEPEAVKRANYTINLLNLNCRRLCRQREDMIKTGLQILEDMDYDSQGCANFAELELAEINYKHFAFITTRRQFFQDFISK